MPAPRRLAHTCVEKGVRCSARLDSTELRGRRDLHGDLRHRAACHARDDADESAEPGEDADAVAAEPSRSERKKAISPNPTRNPKPEPGSRTSARDAWWRFDDEEVTALRGGPFGEPAAKGKDGWTLEPGSYASSDAYLLVYERVDEEGTPCEDIGGDGGAAAAGAARGALPADLAAAVSVENDSLAAMVARTRFTIRPL